MTVYNMLCDLSRLYVFVAIYLVWFYTSLFQVMYLSKHLKGMTRWNNFKVDWDLFKLLILSHSIFYSTMFLKYFGLWRHFVFPFSLSHALAGQKDELKLERHSNINLLEIKPCGLGSRIRDMEAESHNWSHFLVNLW